MAEAYARLAALDAPRARRALDDAVETRDPRRLRDAAPHARPPRAPRPRVRPRARALLEVGEIDDARRELSRALGDAPRGDADAEVVWAVALLYEERRRTGRRRVARQRAARVRARRTTPLGAGRPAGRSPSPAPSATSSSEPARRATSPPSSRGRSCARSRPSWPMRGALRTRTGSCRSSCRTGARPGARHGLRRRPRLAQTPRGVDHARREVPR